MKRHYDFSKGRRGPVFPMEPGKTRITIRIDNEVLDYFRNKVEKAGGGNYQALINNALREYIQGAHLEGVLRRTVREELRELRPK
ncbi:MAG: BrnA antitoxin family protein [Deltaproteobacteria bacterium]|nr:BrnA antitoxin family protein [Deltaproteobacteria bacterium]